MNDLIRRQSAIDALKGLEFCRYIEIGEDTEEVRLIRAEKAQDALEQLPSAQPERKKGKWIIKNKDSYACECPECKKENVYAYIFDYDINAYRQQDWFCPYCGADMRGEE